MAQTTTMQALLAMACTALLGRASAQNCGLSMWGEWSSCGLESGNTVCQAVRVRSSTLVPYDQARCGLLEEAMPCNLQTECALDCELSAWSQWTACDCAAGLSATSTRTRTVVAEKVGAGKPCSEFKVGDVRACPACRRAEVYASGGELHVKPATGKAVVLGTSTGVDVTVDELVNGQTSGLTSKLTTLEDSLETSINAKSAAAEAAAKAYTDTELGTASTTLTAYADAGLATKVDVTDRPAILAEALAAAQGEVATYASQTSQHSSQLSQLIAQGDFHAANLTALRLILEDVELNKADKTTVQVVGQQVTDLTKTDGTLDLREASLLTQVQTLITTAVDAALAQVDACATIGQRWSQAQQKCLPSPVHLSAFDAQQVCNTARYGFLSYDLAGEAVRVCTPAGWLPISVVAELGSSANPARTCAHLKATVPSSVSGFYFVNLGGGQAYEVYCDQTTDGGGWMLVSTQKAQGPELRGISASTKVVPSTTKNQKYPQAFYKALAQLDSQQVMAEENSGPDRTAGAVMVYQLPKQQELGFDYDLPSSTIMWHTGNGKYAAVEDNQEGSAAWLGLSVHASTAFRNLASNKRCTKKSDFSQSLGTNGDYKLDHTGTHCGTTRCLHSAVGLGVSHYTRSCDAGVGTACVPTGETCATIKKAQPLSPSGYYYLTYDTSATAGTRVAYCDQTTDNGGWMLAMTQRPDGGLRGSGALSTVHGPATTVNQRLQPAALASFAARAEYQVMAEENSGPDRSQGAVMVYKLPRSTAISFNSDLSLGALQWHVGGGNYFTVSNNQGGAGAWFGVSCHGSGFRGLGSNRRCTVKSDFSRVFGSNGDYKLDHSGTHSGTTRCFHSAVGIGVAHYLRECGVVGVKC